MGGEYYRAGGDRQASRLARHWEFSPSLATIRQASRTIIGMVLGQPRAARLRRCANPLYARCTPGRDQLSGTSMSTSNSPACQVCHSQQQRSLRRAVLIRPAIAQLAQRETGHWDDNGWICLNDLQRFQQQYVQSLLEDEKGELGELDREVLEGLQKHEILARNPDAEVDARLTLGQRLADRIADFGGSWSFIIVFMVILFSWMVLNSWVLVNKPFDPYPFILLNLVLSTLAAIQAPLIMMSQNRQEERDRARAQHDYQINLKAELEIRQLHQKIDHLLSHQWERLVKIQEVQMELINEIKEKR
jgi:uncharacterized membrane protein